MHFVVFCHFGRFESSRPLTSRFGIACFPIDLRHFERLSHRVFRLAGFAHSAGRNTAFCGALERGLDRKLIEIAECRKRKIARLINLICKFCP